MKLYTEHKQVILASSSKTRVNYLKQHLDRILVDRLKVNEKKSTIFKEKLKDLEHEKIIGISWKSTTKLDKGINLSLERFILGIYSPYIKFLCLQYCWG